MSQLTSARRRLGWSTFDPRILIHVRAARHFLVASILLGILQAVLIVAEAWLIASAVSTVFVDVQPFTFFDSQTDTPIRTQVALLVAVVAGRALLAYIADLVAARASTRAKSELRGAVVAKWLAAGPAGAGGGPAPAELALTASSGIDALDSYFARYLPGLVRAIVVSLLVGAAIWSKDALSALILALTLPLIPVGMVLIGLRTSVLMDRQRRSMSQLSGFFLDLVSGLPTLKMFGRAQAQTEQLQAFDGDHRRASMRIVRVSSLSTLVLELLSGFAVALIAVSAGVRLASGDLDLDTALFVLIAAAEVCLPLHRLGIHQQDAQAAMAAATGLISWLDEPAAPQPGEHFPSHALGEIVLRDVHVDLGAGPVLMGLNAVIPPGKITALVGPSGAGKSTVLGLLLGLVQPTSGSVEVAGQALAGIDGQSWRSRLSWVPQQPVLLAGTVADNVRLGRPDASDPEVEAALGRAGLRLSELPDGPRTQVFGSGVALSAAQRRRVALARALIRDTPILLLDESTAAPDPATEQAVLSAIASWRELGRTVVVVADQAPLLRAADNVIELVHPTSLRHSSDPTLSGLTR